MSQRCLLSEGWKCTSIVEFLPDMCKALDSIPSGGKKKNPKRNKIHKKPKASYFFFFLKFIEIV